MIRKSNVTRIILGLTLAATLGGCSSTGSDRWRFQMPAGADSESLLRQSQFAKDFVDSMLEEQSPESCREPEYRNFRCLKIHPLSEVFVGPFPPALEPDGLDVRSKAAEWFLIKNPSLRDIVWMPVADVWDGEALFSHWRSAALEQRVFGCDGRLCLTVVEQFDDTDPRAVGYGLCRVAWWEAEIKGAPENCFLLAVENASGYWLQARINTAPIGGAGLPDFQLNVFMTAETDPSRFYDAVSGVFASFPLNLRVRRDRERMLGASVRRPSRLLEGVREIVTIRADLVEDSMFNPTLGEVAFLVIEISTTLYVNSLNTSRESDWHLPTVEQQETYVTHLRERLKRRLSAACPDSADWLDSRSLTCGLPDVPARSRLWLP